ncbi:MAG: pseudouridine-5'-phosphate glycosidase [Chloroflexota bacterium]
MSQGGNQSGIAVSPEVASALEQGRGIVALESTVIAHGLPHPENLSLATELEDAVSEYGAVPATVGIVDGQPKVGLTLQEITRLGSSPDVRKVSPRDIPIVVARGLTGATTVAGTMALAHRVGIRVLATGGIGGVHRGGERTMDVSADLPALASTPMIVVCSGPKTLVDASLTLEWLETHGVPIIGYRTDRLPHFYIGQSSLPVCQRVDTSEEVAALATASWRMGLPTAILLVVPAPPDHALTAAEVGSAVDAALAEADARGIRGQQLTPFTLARIRELTLGRSLSANLALLRNNARVAAEIAVAIQALRAS